jgi:hypothetical protein
MPRRPETIRVIFLNNPLFDHLEDRPGAVPAFGRQGNVGTQRLVL